MPWRIRVRRRAIDGAAPRIENEGPECPQKSEILHHHDLGHVVEP
jgi:hypothetical protein